MHNQKCIVLFLFDICPWKCIHYGNFVIICVTIYVGLCSTFNFLIFSSRLIGRRFIGTFLPLPFMQTIFLFIVTIYKEYSHTTGHKKNKAERYQCCKIIGKKPLCYQIPKKY